MDARVEEGSREELSVAPAIGSHTQHFGRTESSSSLLLLAPKFNPFLYLELTRSCMNNKLLLWECSP